MRKSDKVMDLITYCRNRQLMTNLLTNLWQERQTVYEDAFNPQESFFAPPTNAKPRDPKQIFISYSTKDASTLASRLAKDLRDSGHPVWIAPESIMPGEKWGKAIERGLQESGIFILLLTPEAVDSFWVNKEMDAAIRLHGRDQMRVLPLDVQACTPPLFWEDYQFVSFHDGYLKGWAQLWQALEENSVVRPSRQVTTSRPIEQQLPVTSEMTGSFTSQPQGLPNWTKWGGIVVVLLFVFGIGYAILGGGGDDADDQIATIEVVEPTEQVVITAVEIPTEMPTRTATQKPPTVLPIPVLDIGSTSIRAIDGAVMLYVPAGKFDMGSNDGQDDEQPISTVAVDEFWIDQTEVTNGQFTQFITDTNYETIAEKEGAGYIYAAESGWTYTSGVDWQHITGQNSNLNGLTEHPVVLVSWSDASAYCKWVNGRLPTEAEWEYAARGVNNYTYPWGDESPNADLLNYDENIGTTTTVRSYSPDGDSWIGTSDMAGNAWEWTSSLYQPYPYDVNDGRENEDSTNDRVLRGGSWANNGYNSHSAIRLDVYPDYRSNYISFRCAQD